MKTFLEQSLIDLLPLLKTKNDPDEDVRLFRAAEILANVENELAENEILLAKHFIACLVKNYISNITINSIARSASGSGRKTSLMEIGKKIEFSKIESQDYRNAIGFGVSLHQLSQSPFIRPHFEYVLRLVWNNKFKEFHHLTLIDRHYKKAKLNIKKLPLLIVAFPLLLMYLMSKRARPFSDDELRMSFRLLLFSGAMSADAWNNANQVFLASRFNKSTELQDIIRIAGSKLITDKAESDLMQINKMDYEQKYKLMGTKAQKSNTTVDELINNLKEASDPEGMRITNALIIAAQRNPYAVHRYIDVMTDKEKYPKAIAEHMLIQDALVKVNKPALDAILEEIAAPPKEKSNNTRQGAANYSLLSNIIGLEPDAMEYLVSVIVETNNFRKSIAALDAFRRIYKRENVDDSSHMVSYCVSLLRDPRYLKETVAEIEILDPIPRNLLIKIALKSIFSAPIDIQNILFQRLLNGILDWDTNHIKNLLVRMGADTSNADIVARTMLTGSLDDFEDVVEKTIPTLENPNYRYALELILSDPKSPPAYHFNEIRDSNDYAMQLIFQLAESLTLLYQAQIVAPGVICKEVADLERDVEWFSIHPNIKKFVAYFGKNYETYQPFWQNWPCSEKFFAAQENLRNIRGVLIEMNEIASKQLIDLKELFTNLASDDRFTRRSAQEILLKSDLTVQGAEYALNLLELDDDHEVDDEDDSSYLRSRVIDTIYNAPAAADREAIAFMLSRFNSPLRQEKRDFFFRDDLGDVHVYWVNIFIASSIMSSRFVSRDDIVYITALVQNPFLSIDTKAGMISSFHRIRIPELAIEQISILNEFAQSESSSIALAALYSLSKIVENHKATMNQSTLNSITEIFEEIFKTSKGLGFRLRNKKDQSFSFMYRLEAYNIFEFAFYELYKTYAKQTIN